MTTEKVNTERLAEVIKRVRDTLQADAHAHVAGVTIHFNSQGYTVTYDLRTPGSLQRDGISMRNLRGEWIK